MKNQKDTLLKKSVILNQAFTAKLSRSLRKNDQITVSLQDKSGHAVANTKWMKQAQWQVVSKPKEKIKTNNWSNVFKNSRTVPKKYRVVQAPDTGMSYLKNQSILRLRVSFLVYKQMTVQYHLLKVIRQPYCYRPCQQS